jgi:folate-binding protein YgfZ
LVNAVPDPPAARMTCQPSTPFILSGLITNDIRHLVTLDANDDLEDEANPVPAVGKRSMYCMFLNHAGRIVFDTIIFRGGDADEFLIDCDERQLPKLVKHLKLYRVRKKVIVEEAVDLATAVAFNGTSRVDAPEAQIDKPGSVFCDRGQDESPPPPPQEDLDLEDKENIVFSLDPRVPDLGHRLILPESELGSLPALIGAKKCSDVSAYDLLRHRLGVCEGPDEIPPGKCFPLEYNADYMHGVSFHKGCYVGQELTARTHHTGVVRKRIMPVKVSA